MSSKRRAIPNLPADTPRNLRPLLQSLREAMQVLDNSKRGNKLDAAVTFRDLENLQIGGGIAQRIITRVGSGAGPSDSGGDTTIETPTKPTGVEIVAGFDFVLARWDYPTYSGHAYTEIWRQTVDETNPDQAIDFGSASLVGSVDASVFADNVTEQTSHYYWVRHVNKNEVPGPLHDEAGTLASTALRYDQVIDDARAAVLAALEIWQSDFVTALDILDNAVLQLILENGGTINQLVSRVESVESNAAAYYNSTVTTVANQTGSATTQVEALKSAIFRVDENGDPVLDAEGNPVLAQSLIDRVDAVASTVDGEMLAAIGQSLTIDNGEGVNYTLSEILSASLDTDSNYRSQWGIKQAVDDLLYGVGFVSYTEPDGKVRTAFHVAAETFSIFDPALGTEIIPFIVKDNRVLIKDALIDIASISNLVAGTIITGELFAGKKIVSPVIEGGSITGSSININNDFTVNSEGNLRAENAFIRGTIEATQGYLRNVVIHEDCEVRGTISATNIEGDVLDRSVAVLESDITVGKQSDYTIVEGEVIPGIVGVDSDRVLTIHGMAFDHQNGGGSSSNFDVALYLQGQEVQRFRSRNVNEEGSVSVSLGCLIPQGTQTYTFRVALETSTNDNILVQQSAVVIDIVKVGSTIRNLKAFYDNKTSNGGDGANTGVFYRGIE